MKYLVTGSAGFIGFHLAKRLCEDGHEVVGIDSINDYYDPALKYARLKELGIDSRASDWGSRIRSTKYESHVFIKMKLEDREGLEGLFREHGFDRVVNLAAQAGVRHSIDHPDEYIQSNILGFFNILECCRNASTPHLVYASSSSVYGLNKKRPFSTNDNVDHPVSLYAATKKSNELMAHTYSHLYGLPVTGLRFFTVYGPWGRPDMAYYKFANAIKAGKPIEVYNNGEMWRDFTYIDDIIEGVVLTAERIPKAKPDSNDEVSGPAESLAPYRIYNIGNNKSVKLSEFISVLEAAIGKSAIRINIPMQPGDVHATEADIDDLLADFGWRPKMGLVEGMRVFVGWFEEYCKNQRSMEKE